MSLLAVLLPLAPALHVVDQLPVGVVLHLGGGHHDDVKDKKTQVQKTSAFVFFSFKDDLILSKVHLLNLEVSMLAHGAQLLLDLLLDLLHVLDHALRVTRDVVALTRVLAVPAV